MLSRKNLLCSNSKTFAATENTDNLHKIDFARLAKYLKLFSLRFFSVNQIFCLDLSSGIFSGLNKSESFAIALHTEKK